jgi:hypothetical protein
VSTDIVAEGTPPRVVGDGGAQDLLLQRIARTKLILFDRLTEQTQGNPGRHISGAFRTMPVMSDLLNLANPMNVMTQERLKPAAEKDMKKFAEANPDAARDLKTLRTAGLISCLGGVGSVGAGMAFFASRPGTLNGRLLNMALGTPCRDPHWHVYAACPWAAEPDAADAAADAEHPCSWCASSPVV